MRYHLGRMSVPFPLRVDIRVDRVLLVDNEPPVTPCKIWSGRGDLNARPPAPKAGALPGCATPRHLCSFDSKLLSRFPILSGLPKSANLQPDVTARLAATGLSMPIGFSGRSRRAGICRLTSA